MERFRLAYIVCNKRESISNTSSVHLHHVRHHQSTSNTALLERWKHSKRVDTDGPSLLVVTNLSVVSGLLVGLPITRVIHGFISAQTISSLGSDDVSQEDGSGFVLAAGLDLIAGSEGLSWKV